VLADTPLMRLNRIGRETEPSRVPVAVLAGSRARRADLESFAALSQQVQDVDVPMNTSAFHLQFYQDVEGRAHIVATRRVFAHEQADLRGAGELLHEISRGVDSVQGFFIDPGWLFNDLPERIAGNVLAEREHFLGVGETCCNGENEYRAQIHLVSDLDLETYTPEEKDFGPMNIVIDTAEVEQRFRATAWRFFGVAAMLALSLSTGMFLVWRSIRSDLEQAQRTENFVAAVTHELRTPLASIKMHGEMLLDGWAKEPAKQTEYYRRIVRETERLSTLVERVLEKSRLASGSTRPEAGDLSATVGSLREELLRWSEGEHPDLELRLANDLPLVMLTAEAVRSIVVNLVENARKYAPVDFARDDAEPIVVQTKRADDGAVLEVLDRGPGIAPAERERIFQAFYRVGNEATRTSRGTGLGLHLVALQAEALGGKATVRARDGGGSIFSVTFPAAPPDHA
jgi:signal transduction histidine kinase